MAGTTTNVSRIARALLVGLAALLIVGVAGSLFMGSRARGQASQEARQTAKTIAERSLTLTFTPQDLEGPVSDVRAAQLSSRIRTVVLDPSPFESVTLWSPSGEILYSTDLGRIGNDLAGMREVVKEAKSTAGGIDQTVAGTFSAFVPLEFKSTGESAVVELTRPAADVSNAGNAWMMMALFLLLALAVGALALFGVSRLAAAAAQIESLPQPAAPNAIREVPRSGPTVPQSAMRQETEARRHAEDRAKAAEERLAVLQGQYRSTLEELQVSQLDAQAARTAPAADAHLAEERVAAAEERARTLDVQLRRALEDREQLARELARGETDTEELSRARAQAAAKASEAETLRAELEQLKTSAVANASSDAEARAAELEQDILGLRAELEGARTEAESARRDAEQLRGEAGSLKESAARARGLQQELDASRIETLKLREAAETAHAELAIARSAADEVRGELRSLRSEEQRAAMLEEELRAVRRELESEQASHRADLVHGEADIDEKVRAARQEFQTQLEEIEQQFRSDSDASERRHQSELAALRAELEDAHTANDAHDDERTAKVKAQFQKLHDELEAQTARVEALNAELTTVRAEQEGTRAEHDQVQVVAATAEAELEAQIARAEALAQETARAEQEAKAIRAEAARLATALDEAAGENADLARRLQDLEARRQLEIADEEGRAKIDDLLRVTQERLAGQTEKLMGAEDRVTELQRGLEQAAETIDALEGEIRQHQMAEAMRNLREHEGALADGSASADSANAEPAPAGAPAIPLEDRRASTPFTKELSVDAKRTLSKILGITQIMKHKKEGRDQAQLLRQLNTLARRLDFTVADLADADNLARGTVPLTVKRTDLKGLAERVIEESGAEADHELTVHVEKVVIGVDPQRTEQILAGLLRGSSERIGAGKPITIRLSPHEGGALLSVEDGGNSSDASISPVVQRFVDVQGGWVKVESRDDDGGSAFRVFLPDARAKSGDDVRVLIDEQAAADDWDSKGAEQILVQELHRLAELQRDD